MRNEKMDNWELSGDCILADGRFIFIIVTMGDQSAL